ncbi:VWA domain-containing protein [Aminobacter aminovorans]|uniref:VWA domain-containing protein n=1 Tax=Aminobacter aminovorans TaxID=83263 RepID=UPI002862688C|nr:VWA domain-containing protein [Aminobacter aminovorans]MDR7221334.1 Flp pilus assembly protein TadG [Aminobacter aminovorans]
MRKFQGLARAAKRFAGDSSGNFAILGGLTISMLAMAAGFGVNVAQLHNVKSGLSQAVDAAVTSTARDLTTGKIKLADADATVRAFLEANSSRLLAPGEKVVLNKVVVDKLVGTVEASAYIDVNVFFPLFGSANKQRVSARTASLYSDKRIEIAMMLDVTGSMEGQKIEDLKKAATNAVDSLLKGETTPSGEPRVRMSLVPYANSVNVGDLAQSSVFVEATEADRKQAPGNTEPKVVSSSTRPDDCATERKELYQYSDVGPDVSMVNRDLLITAFAKKTKTPACPQAKVVPLTADKDKLKAEIGSFVAKGGTAGHIGIQWAWYTLSENWAGVFQKSERPEKADPEKVSKVAILMTDGEFNLSYFDATTSDEVYRDSGKAATRTAAKTLCEEMRKKGIEIFTIGFKLDTAAAKKTMKDCASPDGVVKRYFETSNGKELDAAFQEVIRNIERLALTK